MCFLPADDAYAACCCRRHHVANRRPYRSCRFPPRRHRLRRLLITLSFFTMPGLAAADIVIDWNIILEQVAPRFGGPQQQSRVQAMVQIAIHDALNAIVPRYDRYAYLGRGRSGASPDAAVAAAARQTLLGLLAHAARLGAEDGRDRHRRKRLRRIGRSGTARCRTQAGIDAGDAAAAAILALRIG